MSKEQMQAIEESQLFTSTVPDYVESEKDVDALLTEIEQEKEN